MEALPEKEFFNPGRTKSFIIIVATAALDPFLADCIRGHVLHDPNCKTAHVYGLHVGITLRCPRKFPETAEHPGSLTRRQ